MKIIKTFKKFNESLYSSKVQNKKVCPNCGSKDSEYIGPNDYKRNDKGEYNRIMGYKCKNCDSVYNYLKEGIRSKMTGVPIEELIEKINNSNLDELIKIFFEVSISINNSLYDDEIYMLLISRIDINFIKNNITNVLDSIISDEQNFNKNNNITNNWVIDILNIYIYKGININNHIDFRNILNDTMNDIGDGYYRDEICKRLLKKYDINKLKDKIIGIIKEDL
jgi:hypothetical protein